MLQGDAGVVNLALLCAAAQLMSQLEALRQPGSAERVALRQQPAGRIGDRLAAIGVVAGRYECGCSPLAAQPQRFIGDQLVLREAVVKLDDIELLRADPACSYTLLAAASLMPQPTSIIMSCLSKLSGRSVVIACAAMNTSLRRPCSSRTPRRRALPQPRRK